MVAFVLRQNNAAVREICPACGLGFSPELGPWPFAPASGAPLCADCATEWISESATDPADLAGAGHRDRRSTEQAVPKSSAPRPQPLEICRPWAGRCTSFSI